MEIGGEKKRCNAGDVNIDGRSYMSAPGREKAKLG